ncbi:MAG: hypothetical protein WBA89_16430 [Microcoleus sp.]
MQCELLACEREASTAKYLSRSTIGQDVTKLWRHINYMSKNNSPNEWGVGVGLLARPEHRI